MAESLALVTACLAIFFLCSFYLFAWTYPCWSQGLPESRKDHENDRYWCAWTAYGTVHATLASALAVPAMVRLWLADPEIRFISAENIEWCMPDENESSYSLLQEAGLLDIAPQVAFVGLMFTVFTSVDLLISLMHGLADFVYVVHHLAFIVAGILIRGNCILPFNAAILISMEISNLPLNHMTFFRHRAGYEFSVAISSTIFVIFFFLFRIGINTCGAIFLWWYQEGSTPQRVPEWQRYFLLIAITIGAVIQFWWCVPVVNAMMKAWKGKDAGEKDENYAELESLEDGEHGEEVQSDSE